MHKLAFSVVPAAFLLSTLGLAQTPSPAAPTAAGTKAHQMPFGTLDKNGDGKLSKAEAQPYVDLTAAFAMLDADRDSDLSPAEFSKWNPTPAGTLPAPPSSTQPRQNNTPQTGQAPAPGTTTTSAPNPQPAAQSPAGNGTAH
jgi:EF hand